MIHPKFYVKELTLADTEYEFVFPEITKKVMIQARTSVVIRMSYEAGKVASSTDPFFTIKSGNTYFDNDLKLNKGTVLYLASPSAGCKVEILSFD